MESTWNAAVSMYHTKSREVHGMKLLASADYACMRHTKSRKVHGVQLSACTAQNHGKHTESSWWQVQTMHAPQIMETTWNAAVGMYHTKLWKVNGMQLLASAEHTCPSRYENEAIHGAVFMSGWTAAFAFHQKATAARSGARGVEAHQFIVQSLRVPVQSAVYASVACAKSHRGGQKSPLGKARKSYASG
eukprot:scaffold148042_cov22-Tisochrysis_lutea.AAC.1